MRSAKQISLCAVMTALALALSYTERLLPLQLLVPLPGVKLGLANIVTLIALCLFRTRYAFVILLLRCLLGAVFGGGIAGLLFSLSGGVLALSVMALSRKLPILSLFGVSVLGAAAHQIGQILAATVLMHSFYVAAYLPWLLLVSVITGLLTGCISAGVLRLLPKAAVQIPVDMGR